MAYVIQKFKCAKYMHSHIFELIEIASKNFNEQCEIKYKNKRINVALLNLIDFMYWRIVAENPKICICTGEMHISIKKLITKNAWDMSRITISESFQLIGKEKTVIRLVNLFENRNRLKISDTSAFVDASRISAS